MQILGFGVRGHQRSDDDVSDVDMAQNLAVCF